MPRRHAMACLSLGLLGLALALLAPAPTARATPVTLKATRDLVWKDFLGVNAHFLWFEPQQYLQQMQRLKALGLEWVRVDLHWDIHEPRQGQLRLGELDALTDSLAREQLKSVFYLVGSAPFASSAPLGTTSHLDQYPPKDPGEFAARMAMLAQRYPMVNAWQVWNEPNITPFWRPLPDPAGYGQLLAASVSSLRAAAPGKPILMAGMAYYSQMSGREGLMLEELFKLGAGQLGAIPAYHPYSQEPEGDVRTDNDFIVRSQIINEQLRAQAVPAIMATEWGWSSYDGPKEAQSIIGQDGQADYVLRRLALMAALDYDRIFLFALSDLDGRATARDQHYGLLDLQGQPKPVYEALQRLLQLTGPTLQPAPPPALAQAPADLYSVSWQRPDDGRKVWMFWSRSGGTVRLNGVSKGTLHDPLTGSQTTLGTDSASAPLAVPAAAHLQVLVW
ncbi:beta-xylosidase [Corticibacter populi]|uniref:Beta-xylosidase n=2 Tax=Corticibacter populi TaxID=1550736 RepID=A0A3M6QKR8_9BURK|nr:beta-xylosidase [Corticibacter populi]